MDSRAFTYNDIPFEFQIETYDLCADWGVAEWASALSDRMFARTAFAMDQRLEKTDGPGGLKELVAERSLRFMQAPLHAPGGGMQPFNGHVSPIRDQSALMFFDGFFATRDSRYSKFTQLAENVLSADWHDEAADRSRQELAMTPAWKMHKACEVDDDEGFVISVDLGASDEHLIEQFKRWIRETRRAAGLAKIPRWFTSADFSKWHEMRFLAYLDLTFWARVRGGHFTLPVLGKSLFPDEFNVGVEDRIRKVVAPGASAIVTEEAVSALNAQRLEAERAKGA